MIDTIVDLSHHNEDIDLRRARAAGVTAVIHKASQGTRFVDSRFHERRALSTELDILFGAYHFGNGENGVDQAEHFVRTIAPLEHTLAVLDIETNPSGDTITLSEAENFVTRFHQLSGIWPGLYSAGLLSRLLQDGKDSVLTNCWLWCADYQKEPIAPRPWSSWTLWQYTDGSQSHSVPIDGIGQCDRNRFRGTENDLKQNLWRIEKLRR